MLEMFGVLYSEYVYPIVSWFYNNKNTMPQFEKPEPLYNELHQAAHENDLKAIARLCKAMPACVNYQTLSGLTPLMIACQRNHKQAVRRLLEYGADVNLTEKTAFKTAMSFAMLPSIKTMLLDQAHCDLHYNHLPLHQAVYQKDFSKTKAALALDDIDINGFDASGRTPLMIACSQKHYMMATYLVNCGADPSLCDHSVTTKKAYGAHEITEDHPIFLKNLQANGFDWVTSTPLHLAAFQGDKKTLEQIFETKAYPINIKDSNDETAIFSAIRGQQKKTLKYLIDQGASTTKRSQDGYTILGYAKHLKNTHQINPQYYQYVKSLIGLDKPTKARVTKALLPLIDKSMLQASKVRKNILIIIGEIHFNSAIDQIRKRIYRYLAQKGIKRAYEEYPAKDYSHHKFEENVEKSMQMIITPIDDGRQGKKSNDDFELRNDTMTQRLLDVNEPGVFTTGSHHLLGFHQRRKLAEKFYILPLHLAAIEPDDETSEEDKAYEEFAHDRSKNIQVLKDGSCSSAKKPLRYWNKKN